MSKVLNCGVSSYNYFDQASISINRDNLDDFNRCEEINLYYYDFGKKLEKRIPKRLFDINYWCEDYIVIMARKQ
jgi:hypothetical protein